MDLWISPFCHIWVWPNFFSEIFFALGKASPGNRSDPRGQAGTSPPGVGPRHPMLDSNLKVRSRKQVHDPAEEQHRLIDRRRRRDQA
jgi:hypothetical protein